MESINDIAIKLSVDAEGVSRGFRTAAEEARTFQKEVERLSYNVGKGDAKQFDAHVIAMQDQRTAAIKDQNDVQEEANRIIRQHMTMNERYAQQLATLVRLNNTTLVATGKQALSDAQLGRAKTALTIATIRQQQAQTGANAAMASGAGGYGGMAMAMGQASYAVEDFTQVLSMGGGLNAALMSASNNLSMVVRALLGTSGAMAAVAGVAVPAALIGTGMFIRYLMEEAQQAKSIADALRDIRDAYDEVREAARRASQQRRLLRDIQNQTSVQGIENDRIEQQDRLNDLLEDQKTLEEELADLRNKASHAGGLGVPLDMLLEDIRRQMESGEGHVGDTEALILKEQQRLRAAYESMQLALEVGNEGDIVTAAKAYRDVLEDHVALFGLVGEGATKSALASVNGLLAQEDALKSLIEAMKEQKVAAEQIADAEKALVSIEAKRIQLMEEEKRLRQENTLFQLQATEAQKSEMDIRQKIMDYIGFTRTQPQDLDVATLLGQNNFDAKDFLDAYIANLEQTKQDMLDQQQVSPIGGMEQNGFQAQADAFKQMLDAQYKQEDPQLRDIDTRIQQSNELLRQLTEGPGVVRIP